MASLDRVADYHGQNSCLTANSGGDPGYAVNYSSNNQVGLGVCDVQCDPYTKDDQPWSTCGDRNGRALHYPISISLYTFEDQRTWLNLVGPLVICLGVCPDFGILIGTQGRRMFGTVSTLLNAPAIALLSWVMTTILVAGSSGIRGALGEWGVQVTAILRASNDSWK